MSENNALRIVEELLQLHVDEPNDMEFGGKVRELIWNKIHKDNANY